MTYKLVDVTRSKVLQEFETIEQAATEDTSGRVRSILGSFLFKLGSTQ